MSGDTTGGGDAFLPPPHRPGLDADPPGAAARRRFVSRSVSLTRGQQRRLARLAAASGLGVSELVRRALDAQYPAEVGA